MLRTTTAAAALLTALAWPAVAQVTDDADVIVVDPEADEAEVVTDPAVTDDVEILDGADAEVVAPEAVDAEPDIDDVVTPEVTEVEPAVEDVEVVETDPAVAEADAMQMDGLIRTRDMTGGPVYSTGEEFYDEARWTATDPLGYDDTAGAYEPYGYDQNYDNIGEIEDIVLDSSGQMRGIVAEVGGFLGIGDHHVMLPVEDVRLVPVDDSQYAYVTRYTEEQLEQLPSVDEGPFE